MLHSPPFAGTRQPVLAQTPFPRSWGGISSHGLITGDSTETDPRGRRQGGPHAARRGSQRKPRPGDPRLTSTVGQGLCRGEAKRPGRSARGPSADGSTHCSTKGATRRLPRRRCPSLLHARPSAPPPSSGLGLGRDRNSPITCSWTQSLPPRRRNGHRTPLPPLSCDGPRSRFCLLQVSKYSGSRPQVLPGTE